MLSTGTIAAPSACLRCQLRQVISHTGRRVSSTHLNSLRVQTKRAFIASQCRRQDGTAEGGDAYAGSNEMPKLSEYPLGRVYGKPGRRHRETSARLSQDSMQRPFEVVVLRDLPDQKETRINAGDRASQQEVNRVDASQIARDVLDKGTGSNEVEIIKSINALQPETAIVEDEQYNSLAQILFDGYTMRQLSQYLAQSLHSASIEARGKPGKNLIMPKTATPVLAWRPQSSPSDHVENETETINPKSQLVQQILRRSWNLSIEGEVHQIGYLEMKLEPWQLSYLFDLYQNSKPMHETWIQSPLLLRSSKLRPDRADNVLRVIARKQDAEEIAERIYHKLRNFESLELDLSAFKPANGRRRRSKSSAGLPSDDMLEIIQRRLFCIFERKNSTTMVIHAPLEVTLWHARRAFLSLLDLPSPNSIESMIIPESVPTDEHANPVFLPEWLAPDIKTQSSMVQYERLASPSGLARTGSSSKPHDNTQSEVGVQSSQNAHATEVADRLSQITQHEPADLLSSSGRPFWELGNGLHKGQWEVQICKILRADSKTSNSNRPKGTKAVLSDTSRRSTIQSQIPGITNLLQCCSPTSSTTRPPLIIAHFLPNPFTRHGLLPLAKLPRIRLTYTLVTDNERPDTAVANLSSIRAVFAEQELRVQLSQEATDLRFVRQTTLPGMRDTAFDDREIQKFTEMLQHSLNRKRSFLDGEPEVRFPLPSSPFEELTDQWARDLQANDYEFDYLFERFEQVQSTDLIFTPDSTLSGDKELLLEDVIGEMPSDVYLQYQEIEGGVVGGRRTELRLMQPASSESPTRSTGPNASRGVKIKTDDQAQLEQKHFRLADTSLRLAKAMTEINAGQSNQIETRVALQSGS